MEIIVLDGSAPAAALHLFPLGVLREPLEMAEKADIILVNKGEPDGRVKELDSGHTGLSRPVPAAASVPSAATARWPITGRCRAKKCSHFPGLGDNSSFFGLFGTSARTWSETLEFPDHHRYRAADLRRIESFQNVEMAVTTEKDAVRIEGMETGGNIFYLSIEAEFDAAGGPD